jgi:hypothetical protein
LDDAAYGVFLREPPEVAVRRVDAPPVGAPLAVHAGVDVGMKQAELEALLEPPRDAGGTADPVA